MLLKELKINQTKIAQFEKKGITSVEDLVNTFPRKYIDYREAKNPTNAESGKKCSMILRLEYARKREMAKMGICVDAECREVTTESVVTIRWIGQEYKYEEIQNLQNMKVVVCGVFKHDEKWGDFFYNPEIFSTDIQKGLIIHPLYSAVKGMSNTYYENSLNNALEVYDGVEKYDDETLNYFGVIKEKEMLQKMHHPTEVKDIQAGNKRIVFDMFYNYATKSVTQASIIKKNSDFKPILLTNCNKLIRSLPYELTEDQKKVVSSFVTKAKGGNRVNALIQGDVGSGKTVCAFILMVAMSDNGYQSVLMAPTGVLAKQHYLEFKNYVEPMGLKVVYLSGELKAKEKKEAIEKIKSGEANFVIGTHSVISDDVEFKNLGLTIVDEEHKFGVLQRENLKKKADEGVHTITMSATPIPRTLAMTLYENAMDIYTIESMPNGRKPVKTAVVNNDAYIFQFMEQEIKFGHQCYIVCPLISDNDDVYEEEVKTPESVDNVFKKVSNYFSIRGNIKVGVITGKMKEDEKNEIINDFKNNRTQILIATTIIEVGVNVPNATVITIMDAERFGLAGLHQLRGRVGRGSLQSYCLLKSTELNNERLKAMCESTNGFEIAEADLKQRGAGEFLGTKQSGNDENIRLILKYPKFYKDVKDYVISSSPKDTVI